MNLKTQSQSPIELLHQLEALLNAEEAPKRAPSVAPTSQRLVEALEASLTRLPPPAKLPVIAEPKHEETIQVPTSGARTNDRELAERAVIVAAVDIVASWNRRRKQHFQNQEKNLRDAVKALASK